MSRRIGRCALILIVGALVAGSLAGTAQAADRPSTRHAALLYSPTRVLVGYEPGTRGARAQVERYAGATRFRSAGAGTQVLRVPRGNVLSAIAALNQFSQVAYAEPDYVLHATDTVPNDPSFGSLWGMQTIQAPKAWDVGTGTATPVVGVVDTGIDYTHPDLAANVWSNPGGVGNAVCVAGTHGYNAIAGTCTPMDDNNHGTHVSGTIGAVGNNGVGVAGVNWTTRLMGLKFLSAQGYGYTSDAVTAIDFAVKARQAYNADPTQGANVVALNNSWGGGSFSTSLLNEINAAGSAGIVFVVAAGNSSYNMDVVNSYPCSYNTTNMICVAATTQTDGLASFSNYGTSVVDLGAPGTNIYSTIPGNGYASFSGTSMATPHVTGAVALVAALCSSVTTVAGRRDAVLNNTDPLSSLSGKVSTGGRLNLSKAVNSCAGPPPTPDFSLSASPATLTVNAGQSGQSTVTISRVGGFADAVSLSTTGLPPGATPSFSPNDTTGNSSTLTLATSSGLSPGSYPFTISGTNGTLTHSTTATLVVQQANYTLAISPTSRTVRQSKSTSFSVTIQRTGGFAESVALSVSGLPSGATAAFSVNPATGSSTLTVRVSSSATVGTYSLVVTGNSTVSHLVRTVTATLTVRRH